MLDETTDRGFQADVLESKSTLTLVDFYAPWCSPCKVISALLEEMHKEFPQVKFLKLNVDENPHTAQNYSIGGIPTLILFKAGQAIGNRVGAINKEALREFINSSQDNKY